MDHRYCRLAAVVLFLVPALPAQRLTGRYIVELNTEPVARMVGRTRPAQGLRGSAAVAHRARVQAEQATVEAQITARQFKVLDRLDTVSNALIVEAPDAAQLSGITGVRKVYAERLLKPLLDRAVALHKVTDAWTRIGGSQYAGAGIKVGIIDTGIEISNTAFQDASLTTPAGFPKTNATADLVNTNSKVIVARSYVSLLPARDPDTTVRDHVGHGTALAMIVAGNTVQAPLATLTGVAPKAWLGVYKVFGTPGYNDGASDAALLKAIDDAVKDGMDVINISLGVDEAARLADDPDVAAVENATAAGVIVVVAAGNNGTDPNTIASPATAPSAISAGATTNDRDFAATVEAPGVVTAIAIPGTGPAPSADVAGTVVAVKSLDGNGLGCAAFPAGSLQGQIALIQRGSCTFETKLNNAAAAGAIGGVIFAAPDAPAAFIMSVGAATLPAEMISNGDGVTLAAAVNAGTVSATMHFSLVPVPITANQITDFSAAGPSVDLGIKPDVLAVGGSIYVATQTYDSNGEMYDPSGYILIDGTSFSSPLTAGASALLKAARPGLTVNQYRSLLVHSANPAITPTGDALPVQRTGGGILNVDAALQSTVAAYPISLSFGATKGALASTLTVTNLSTVNDTFTLSPVPLHGSATPNLDQSQLQLGPGATGTVKLTWDTTGLDYGTYDGTITINAASTGLSSRVPYWFASSTANPTRVTTFNPATSGRRASVQRNAVYVRVTDEAGLIVANPTITVTVVSGGGRFQAIRSYDSSIPGLYGIDVVLGPNAGTNVFQVSCGSATVNFSITGT